MSELAKTIDRLEQWADYWEDHQVPELIADLRTLIGAAKAISRAVELLQGLEDVTVTSGDGHLELMVCAHAVDHAVAILNGGAAMSEPVKITLGTRVVVEIGGADFELGRVYDLTWAPVDDYVFKIASPDGTVSKIPMQAGPPRMHLTLCCEAMTEQEGQQ